VRAEATMSRLSLVPAMFKTTPIQCPSMSCPPCEVGARSTEDGEEWSFTVVSLLMLGTLPRCQFRLLLRARASPRSYGSSAGDHA
jgi:hypothetical protein